MTVRLPISTIENRWHDAQMVDQTDMDVEQNHVNQNDAAIVNNQFGSGILPSSVTQNILFDSDNLSAAQYDLLVAGLFDGTGINVNAQPTDTNLGNQLEVELTDSEVFGRLSVKVLIIGLDFESNIQYDRLIFYRNGKQVTRAHYTNVISILFNDFLGNNNCSRTNGGRITIKEASSFQLSKDTIMFSQDYEPNLFFRDFKIADPTSTLQRTIQAAIGPTYTHDSLAIDTNGKFNRTLLPGDVTSKIGEKFLAVTDNIQKITLLLGASGDYTAPIQNRYDWTGNLVISIYELQNTVSCPTQLIPDLSIEYDPGQYPLAQLSFTQAELKDLGYVLTDVNQPVDFIFNATQLGSTTNSIVVPGRYYCITVNRSGATGTGTILVMVGNSRVDNTRVTLFSGGSWIDVPEENLWFQVWTDAAKVADGQAYDGGNGIEIDKTAADASTGATVDYCLKLQAFVDTGENTLNTAIVQATQTPSLEEQDERTGNPVYSRQQFEPTFSFVTNSTLATLQTTSEPLIIGGAKDTNPKDNDVLSKLQSLPGLVKGDTFTVVNPDADLLSLNLIGSKLIPNDNCAALDYRIFRVTRCTDGYGDVNGDGVIDGYDVVMANNLLGESLSSATTQQKIIDGYFTTLEILRADVDGDGTITSADVQLISQYVNRTISTFPVGVSFVHLEIQVQQSIGRYDGYFDCNGYVRLDGYTGSNIVDPALLDSYTLMYDGYLAAVSMDGADPEFSVVPYVPIPYRIQPQPFWQDYLIALSSDARIIPAAFTYPDRLAISDCTQASLLTCIDTAETLPTFDPGRNDIMIPDNLIMRRGQILNPDGSHYKIDFEVNHIILKLPPLVYLDGYVIDVFRKLVADAGDGFTSAGYPAMRFSDCTTVPTTAMIDNQVRFGVSIQAFIPNLDGYDIDDGYCVIVDDSIGVSMDYEYGILSLSVKDLDEDPIDPTQVTKIQITVYLKKAGWNNTVRIVESSQIQGLLA